MSAAPVGHNPQAVIDALKHRAAVGDPQAARSDGRKIGLVIEGGSMRAVCSGGGAVALAHLGLVPMFDAVFATSAGVMNGSYLLSDQPLLGIRVYYEDLNDRRFVNPLRLWKVMNIDYVFDHVVKISKPLAVDRVLASRPDFFVSVMDAETAEGRIIDVKHSPTPVLQILKAATAMPVFYNRTVEVEGRPCMDAGLVIPFPIEAAIAHGCTDVLVLLTNPPEHRDAEPAWRNRFLFNRICARGNEHLRRVYAQHHQIDAGMRDLAVGRRAAPAGINIASFCTEPSDKIHRETFDRTVLRDAANRYGRRVLAAFGEEGSAWELPPIGGAG